MNECISRVLVIATVLFGSFGAPHQVQAHTDYWEDAHSGNDGQINEGRHENVIYWPTDGCSHVADSKKGVFYFEHACDHHDGCYRNHWATREACDDEFFDDMEASCVWNWGKWTPNRLLCRGTRTLYYEGVRARGEDAYDSWSTNCGFRP